MAVRFRIKGTDRYVPVYTGSIGDGAPAPLRADSFAVGEGGGQAYDAAGGGRRARTWKASSAGPNASLTYALPTLIARSRDAVRKNPFADMAVSTLVGNLVGTGIVPRFKTPDEGLNDDLQQLWRDWTDEADADGMLDFYGLQSLAARGMTEAGEAFARLRVREAGDMATVPLQVQVLESEFCPVNEFRLDQQGDVRNGIVLDALGRRTAYLMYRQHPYDWAVTGGFADLTPMPVPAHEVLHVMQMRRAGQLRGEPRLTRALIKLRDLDAYDDAELARKKTAAMFAGFITSPEGLGEFTGEDLEVDEEGAAPITLEPAIMHHLQPGEEVSFSAPADVGASYEAFMRQQLRAVAVAGGVLYEQLTGDYSKVNDRTFRASVNEFRRAVEMQQHQVMVFQFCRPLMERWLATAQLAGLIRVPDSFGPRDLYRVEWMPPAWAYINPVQDVQARRDEVRAGFTSRARVVAERGYDVEELDREIAQDHARADASGLVFDSDPRKTSGAGLTQARPAGSEIPGDDNPDDEQETDDA